MVSSQQWFEGATDFGPELDLAGDGPFHRLPRDPRVQEQRIRNLDWLTHVIKVAKRYQLSRGPSAAQAMADGDGNLPVWVRAPKCGHEFYSGCTRPKLYDWAGKGFIRSVSIREPGRIKGLRLFHLASNLAFIEQSEIETRTIQNNTHKPNKVRGF